MSGWSWYCKPHDSFGHARSENEIKYLANSHLQYFAEQSPKCDIQLNQHLGGKLEIDESAEKTSDKSGYMAKVKESFGRAWSKWSESEDTLLKINFENGLPLNELTSLHKRAEGGIISRLKKLQLIDSEMTFEDAKKLLNKKDRPVSLSKPTNEATKQPKEPTNLRIDRGRDSFREFGTVNPPPVAQPNLTHTSLFTCSICGKPVIGNSCLCRD